MQLVSDLIKVHQNNTYKANLGNAPCNGYKHFCIGPMQNLLLCL